LKKIRDKRRKGNKEKQEDMEKQMSEVNGSSKLKKIEKR